MILLEPHPLGVVLPVKAQPGAKQNALRGEQDGALKASVTQIAERGKANAALVKLLCKTLELRTSQIELLSGETSPQKRFLVRDIAIDELSRRIEAAIGN